MMGKEASRRGQVMLEVLLVFPLFLTLVFGIMEVGHLCFWEIVLNHGTFEAARIASLEVSPTIHCNNASCQQAQLKDPTPILNQIIGNFVRGGAQCQGSSIPTLQDPQALNMNHDLVASCSYCVSFLFPTSYFIAGLSNCTGGNGRGGRRVNSTIRMPIEEPVTQ